MARGGEKAAPNQACPKAIVSSEERGREGKSEVEDLKFICGIGHLGDVRPPARDLLQDNEKAQQCAGDIKEHLYNIGPDDRSHSPLERIEESQANDYGD